jgi:hypothetical protein
MKTKQFLLLILRISIGMIPYIIGLLLVKPAMLDRNSYHLTVTNFTERSVIFFAFALSLNCLILAIKKQPKTLINTFVILVIGSLFLVILAKANTTYRTIPGAFILILILTSLLPLQNSFKISKSWTPYATTTLLTNFTIALTSITIHYAEFALFIPLLGLSKLSKEIFISGAIEAISPLLLALCAGCLGSIADLGSVTKLLETRTSPKHSTSQNGTNPINITNAPNWYTDLTIMLLAIPPFILGLMSIQGLISTYLRFSYIGILGAVILQTRFRNGRIAKTNFTTASLLITFTVFIYFLLLGQID